MALRVANFKGEAPRVSPRALPNEMSVSAINARLLSGDLEAWKDLASVFLLGKAGPTNTAYLFEGKYWFSWAQAEVTTQGATRIDVAHVPVANDSTNRTVFTGAGKPQITNHALALAGGVIPNGPYPVSSINLGVPAPATAPTVVHIPGAVSNTISTTNIPPTPSGWLTGVTGGTGGVTLISGGGHATIAYPCYEFRCSQTNKSFANAVGGFGTALSSSFTVDFDVSSTDGGDLVEDQDAWFQIVSDGNGAGALGAQLEVKFTASGGGHLVWTDKAAGTAPQTLLGTVTASEPIHVHIAATSLGRNANNILTFSCTVTVTDANTHAVISTTNGLTATYAGDALSMGGENGDNPPNTGLVYFGRIAIAVSTPPANFTPTYSNYLFTRTNQLNLESGPSPASTPAVQVDNNNINVVTIPTPPGGEVDNEFYLYRVATGSSGSQYELVPNGSFSDGGFPVATVAGTPNAITLTTADGAGPANNTSYFGLATATNTGAMTAALNGNPAAPVVDTNGNALAAGAVVNGQPYTWVYNRKIIQACTNQMPANGIAPVVQLNSTQGILVGQVVTDAVGAVAPGTTVAVVTASTVTLSQPLAQAMNAGSLFYFQPTSNQYTLLSGYTYRDATPTSALGSALLSTDWDTPPDNLIGIIALPNEILAGFFGDTLCFSVAGQPQAWPLTFQLGTDSPIAALVALGFNVGVLTTGRPYTVYGTDPASMQMGIESFTQGCQSARGTTYHRDFGALYPSTDGIYAYAGFGQIRNVTERLFTRREWQALNPSTIIGQIHQGLYFFWYQTVGGTKLGKILDLNADGFGLASVDFHAITAAIDSSDDNFYLVLDSGNIAGGVAPANNQLVQWETAATYRPGSWTSKLFQEPYDQALMMERVRAASYAGLTTTLFVNGVAQSTLSPSSAEEFTFEPWKGLSHQFVIAWGTTNPDVQDIQYVEQPGELQ